MNFHRKVAYPSRQIQQILHDFQHDNHAGEVFLTLLSSELANMASKVLFVTTNELLLGQK